MFATGLPIGVLVFFAAASMMVVIPSTIQIYAWLFTVNLGKPDFRAPLLFIGGFIALFVIGGLSGIMFAAIPFDQATTDTYFVVAHFHFIIFGAAVFPILGGLYYWFPKVTGRMYHERWAQASFWVTFVGTIVTFFPMHLVGLDGMTRRVYTYHSRYGWSTSNLIETVGAFVLTVGLLMIFANLAWSRFRGAPSGPDPFYGGTLEWTTSSPPPPYNFAVIPTVSSPYPNWEPTETVVEVGESHETATSTVRDGLLDEVVRMPSESGWPIVLAAVVLALFVMLLTSHIYVAAVFACLAPLVLVAWHMHEPEQPA
jgi:heme/copper-type cytochrome/quinol oxidase subunit 1